MLCCRQFTELALVIYCQLLSFIPANFPHVAQILFIANQKYWWLSHSEMKRLQLEKRYVQHCVICYIQCAWKVCRFRITDIVKKKKNPKWTNQPPHLHRKNSSFPFGKGFSRQAILYQYILILFSLLKELMYFLIHCFFMLCAAEYIVSTLTSRRSNLIIISICR